MTAAASSYTLAGYEEQIAIVTERLTAIRDYHDRAPLLLPKWTLEEAVQIASAVGAIDHLASLVYGMARDVMDKHLGSEQADRDVEYIRGLSVIAGACKCARLCASLEPERSQNWLSIDEMLSDFDGHSNIRRTIGASI